jgi:hypothetical protein
VVDGKVWKKFDQFGIEVELGNVRFGTGSPNEGIYTLNRDTIWVADKKGVIIIRRNDDGPWWDVIRMAIPKLEKDAKAMAARIPELTREMLEPQERQRREELQRAAESVKKNKMRW